MGHIPIESNVTLVTPTELYNISDKPAFVGQSRSDDEGNFSIQYRIDGKLYQTNNNLFN